MREGEEEGIVIQAPLFGSPGAPFVEPLTPMEIEERDLASAAEQDKAVPFGSLGGGEAAARPGAEAAIVALQGNANFTLDDAIPSG
eukprot:1012960-Lingulodinium_polyedra.AAC.1